MKTEQSPPARTLGPRISTVIKAALAFIGILCVAVTIPVILHSWHASRHAGHVVSLNILSDHLFQAVRNLGYERGRVNVVLGDAGPVEGMEGNRTFILARRAEADQALESALASLPQHDLADVTDIVERIVLQQEQVAELRQRAAHDMLLEKSLRDPGLPKQWFPAMTGLIQELEILMEEVFKDIRDSDGLIARYLSIKEKSLALRNTAGPEMSILSATMLSGEPITPSLHTKINDNRVETETHLRDLVRLCSDPIDPRVKEAIVTFQRLFDDRYLPLRAQILSAALSGGPYPLTQPEFLGNGVVVLESIAGLMDATVGATRDYAEQQLLQTRRDLSFAVLALGGCLVLIALTTYTVHRRVTLPLSRLSQTLRCLASGQLDVQIPPHPHADEIADLTESVHVFKQTAQQLREDIEARRLAEMFLARAQQVARVGNWEITQGDPRVRCSAELRRLFGMRLPKTPTLEDLLSLVHPDDQDRVATGTRAILSRAQPMTRSYRLLSGPSQERVVEETVEVEEQKQGQPVRILGTVQDVTERKRLEEQLLQIHKLESLQVVAGGVAHDFNNKLAGILGYLELALAKGGMEADTTAMVQTALDLSLNAAAISQKMLAYTGRRFTAREWVDADAVIRSSLELARQQIPADVRLSEDFQTGPLRVIVGQADLTQTFFNLFRNALEAVQNRPNGRIGVVLRKGFLDEERMRHSYLYEGQASGNYACLEITDNGEGIRAVDLPRIFDPFFTTRFTGRGLGLAVVLGIARANKAVLEVVSKPGQGSTFRVHFPLLAEEPMQAEEKKSGSPPIELRGKRVLVIDDDPQVADVTRRFLERNGITVTLAASGEEGLDRYREATTRYDAVILDLTMPRMSGAQVYRELRAFDSEAKVIITSGYAEAQVQESFGPDRPPPFLKKPATEKDVLRALANVLLATD